MSKISEIRTALTSAIKSMTIANGYNYDWTTVNPPGSDWNRVAADKHPIADFWFEKEESEDGTSNTLTITNDLTVLIDVVPKRVGIEAADVDKCIDDIKRLAGNDYNLSGACFLWWYQGYERFNDQTHYPEYGARIRTIIRYRQDRKNP